MYPVLRNEKYQISKIKDNIKYKTVPLTPPTPNVHA